MIKNRLLFYGVAMTAAILVGAILLSYQQKEQPKIDSFEACTQAGYPILMSYPRRCVTPDGKTFIEEITQGEYCTKTGTRERLSLVEAKQLAQTGECAQARGLKKAYRCDEVGGNWWIDLTTEKEGCFPACIIDVVTKEVEINWRCTGLLPPDEPMSSPVETCKNLCGDGICQEIVCMALGCPCAESPITCPSDCK